jgi:chromate transporter
MKGYFELFFVFFKVGCTTFGGGYAILPVIERELIRQKGWITMEEALDYYTIGQLTPGVIAVNVTTFIGYKQKGVMGGIIATLGFICPSLVLITLIALFLQNFAEIPLVKHAFGGIRIAVGALVAHTVIRLIRGFHRDIRALVIFIAVLGCSAVLSASPVLLILAAGAGGFLLYGFPRGGTGNSGPREGGTEDTGPGSS